MIKHILYSIILIQLFSITAFAQDDSEEGTTSAETFEKEELLKEKHLLNFKASFIESIKQRSIENYDKALESLSICENIYPNNEAMLFEKAKNHFALKQYIEAHHYCDKALDLNPNNFWIKTLSRDIFEKEHNFPEAIKIQKELYSKKQSEAGNLLKLYYRTKKIKEGQMFISEIDRKSIYVLNLDFYKKHFKVVTKSAENNNFTTKKLNVLQNGFSQNNNYVTLQKILEKEVETKQFKALLKDSDTGLSLFPAQAKVYLYKGLALNGLQKYQEAVSVLESGLDFVFDNPTLTKRFYYALIEGYNGINNTVKANHYKQLVQKL